MGEDNKLVVAIALVAGIAIGANWDKIKEALGPMLSSLTKQASSVAETGAKFVAEQKEKIEDKIAAAKIASAKKNLQTQESAPTGVIPESEEVIIKRKMPEKPNPKPVATAVPS